MYFSIFLLFLFWVTHCQEYVINPAGVASPNEQKEEIPAAPLTPSTDIEVASYPGFLVLSAPAPQAFYATFYQVPWELADELYENRPQYVSTSDLGFVLRYEVRNVTIEQGDGSEITDQRGMWIVRAKETDLGYTLGDEGEDMPPADGVWMLRNMQDGEYVSTDVKVYALTCQDGVENGDEEGTDCGGKFCPEACKSCSIPPDELKEYKAVLNNCTQTLDNAKTCQLGCETGLSMIGGEAKCNNGELEVEATCVPAPKWLFVEGHPLVEGDYMLAGTYNQEPIYVSLTAPERLGHNGMLLSSLESKRWNLVLSDPQDSNSAAVVAYRDSETAAPWEADENAVWQVYDVEKVKDSSVEEVYSANENVTVIVATCSDGKWDADELYTDCGGSEEGCRKCGGCSVEKLLPSGAKRGLCKEDLMLQHGEWCAPECAEDTVLWGSAWQCVDGEVEGKLECIDVPGVVQLENFQAANEYLNGEYSLLFALALYSEEQMPQYAKFDQETGLLYVLTYRPDLKAWAIQNSLASDAMVLAWSKHKDTPKPRTPLEITQKWQTAQAEG